MVVPGYAQPRDRSSGRSQTWNAWVATVPTRSSISRHSGRWATSRRQTSLPWPAGWRRRADRSPHRVGAPPAPPRRRPPARWRVGGYPARPGNRAAPLTVTSGWYSGAPGARAARRRASTVPMAEPSADGTRPQTSVRNRPARPVRAAPGRAARTPSRPCRPAASRRSRLCSGTRALRKGTSPTRRRTWAGSRRRPDGKHQVVLAADDRRLERGRLGAVTAQPVAEVEMVDGVVGVAVAAEAVDGHPD
jgi:hypothetical protein